MEERQEPFVIESQKEKSVYIKLREAGKYKVEADYALSKMPHFSVLLFGPPRAGKSTLVNAMCGSEKAGTSPRLDSCTPMGAHCYEHVVDYQIHEAGAIKNRKTHITFYDTGGVEDWSEAALETYITKLLGETKPLCAILCARPGNRLSTTTCEIVLGLMQKKSILTVGVCTQMYDAEAEEVFLHLCDLVLHGAHRFSHEEQLAELPDGTGPFCIQVNSKVYENRKLRVSLPPCNIDLLIYHIMKRLSDEQLVAWCMAILANRGIWESIGHHVKGFFNEKLWNNFILGGHEEEYERELTPIRGFPDLSYSPFS